MSVDQIFKNLGIEREAQGVFDGEWKASGEWITSTNPATGEDIGRVRCGNEEDYERCIAEMSASKAKWMNTPAPVSFNYLTNKILFSSLFFPFGS